MYAKLVNNTLEFADNIVVLEDMQILNPQKEDYLNAGYKKVQYAQMPAVSVNEHPVETYSQDEETIYVAYAIEQNPPVVLSKEDEIKRELFEIDIKTIRALRANETKYIAQYETQAQALREQLPSEN